MARKMKIQLRHYVTCVLALLLATFHVATFLAVESESPTVAYLTDIAHSGDLWWSCGIQYSRIIVLQHSQIGQNNVLLATSEELTAGLESYRPGYPIYRSTDQGKTWSRISFVQESLTEISSEFQPTLFELSAPCGDYPTGTLFLAACSVDSAHAKQSAIRLYASRDGGESFEEAVTVAVGGGTENAVWEPFLIQLDDGRMVCYYSDSTESEKHSQKIVYKVSSDGRIWSDAADVVALDRQSDRPGMPVVTRLGDGTYFMTYEIVNNEMPNGNPVTCRTSRDGLNWGDPDWAGDEIVSVDGKALGSAPYCAWTPVGGEDGTLIVSGTFMRRGSSGTGTDYFLSTDKGKTWTTTPHAIPYPNSSMDHVGYSNSMAFTADGKVMYAVNNPPDSNVKGHAKLVCAMVEWVDGAAALPENIPVLQQTVSPTDGENNTTGSVENTSSAVNDQTSEDGNTLPETGNTLPDTGLVVTIVILSVIAVAVGVWVLCRLRSTNEKSGGKN